MEIKRPPMNWRQWCQSLMSRNAWCVIDTETTGRIIEQHEACEIAVTDYDGRLIFSQIIRPTITIPAEVEAIHHISNEMVKRAPTFAQIWPELRSAIEGKTIIAYNSKFDGPILNRTAQLHKIDPPRQVWMCAMERYAEHWNEPGKWPGSAKWQRLSEACRQQGIQIEGRKLHRAAGDTRLTWELIRSGCEDAATTRTYAMQRFGQIRSIAHSAQNERRI